MASQVLTEGVISPVSMENNTAYGRLFCCVVETRQLNAKQLCSIRKLPNKFAD